MPTIEQIRRVAYVAQFYGMRLPVEPVCRDHQSPGMMVAQLVYDRPPLCLWHASRGSGKSLGSSLANYILGQMHPDYESKILGGSQAQSEQIYRGMDFFRKNRPEADAIREMLKTEAWFHSGAHVQMLTASEKSVRGPHVPQLCLDEVDEIDDEIREHAFGMVMRKGELSASVSMTSTWHRAAGPMARLIAEGREEGKFPVGTFCMFDVLERCPEERSGKDLERCPECPLMRWCHADRDAHPSGLPKAKRSAGHYSIDALIQKTLLSLRVFESDYLSLKPRSQGAWFADFDDDLHVNESAEYRIGEPFHVSIDGGVHTGAVLFQIRQSQDRTNVDVNVFGDYYAEHLEGGASAHAAAIMALTKNLTGNPIQNATVSMDSACRVSTSVGPSVLGEYKRMGCTGKHYEIRPWPVLGPGRSKADSLGLVESLLMDAGGKVSIKIHPRCRRLIEAFKSYVRKQSTDGQWLDEPKDPQHPSEEAIDSLSGGLGVEMPEGRAPTNKSLIRIPARRVVG